MVDKFVCAIVSEDAKKECPSKYAAECARENKKHDLMEGFDPKESTVIDYAETLSKDMESVSFSGLEGIFVSTEHGMCLDYIEEHNYKQFDNATELLDSFKGLCTYGKDYLGLVKFLYTLDEFEKILEKSLSDAVQAFKETYQDIIRLSNKDIVICSGSIKIAELEDLMVFSGMDAGSIRLVEEHEFRVSEYYY